MPKDKKCGNGLGENKIKSWSPGSVGDYKRGLQKTSQDSVPSEKRKGAGSKN